jgi:mannose-6-phosphate isomerase-like protein (cupin superfamily)
MSSQRDYDIHLDDKYGSLTVIDLPSEITAHDPWFNQTLTTVNDAVVRLGIIEGEFHWHKHDGQDEFFLVLDGELLIDLEDRDTVDLGHHQAFTVPKGRPAPHTCATAHGDSHGRSRWGHANRRLTHPSLGAKSRLNADALDKS